MERYVCSICGNTYTFEELGKRIDEMEKGWRCPMCGAGKSQFYTEKIEGEETEVTVFRYYPFRVGEKIHIEDGPRKGDWEVVSVDDRKVLLRCPVTKKEFKWDRFCFFVEKKVQKWPK